MESVVIYAPKHGGEPWGPNSPALTGIGGSETAVIEMARRLGERGHSVTVYAPITGDLPGVYVRAPGGAGWRRADEVKWNTPGVWICHRAAAAGELLQGQRALHVTHDMDPPDEWTPERAAGFERILCLSRAQLVHYRATWPFMADRLALWGNGIDAEAMEAGDADALERDPKRLIYSSSPDRGLEVLLSIFRRAYEIDPELSLDVYYGWGASWPWPALRARIERLADHPGVFWHGRVPQPELHEAFRRSGLWVYPTHFHESSCIGCMEAQALGAIPITRPFWALAENVRHGIFIEGDPSDYLVRARYTEVLLALANDTVRQDAIRGQMVGWARRQFDWGPLIDTLEGWIEPGERRIAA